MSRSGRRGFTLTEMVVALALLAVMSLLGVIGARAVLTDTKEQLGTAAVQTVLAAENRYMIRTGHFTADPSEIGIIPDVTVTGGVSNSPQTVSVAVDPNGNLAVAAMSREGCFIVAAASPLNGGGTVTVRPGSTSVCSAQEGLAAAFG